jgi:hypothetical protein
MTLIRRRTDNWVIAFASSALTHVALRTCVSIITDRILRLRGIRTYPGRRVTRARVMTLIRRTAHHGVTPRARTTLTTIRLRTRIAITARRAIRLIRMLARSIHHNVFRTRVPVILTRAIFSIQNTCTTAQFLSTRTRIALTTARRTRHFARTRHRITPAAIAALALIRLRTTIQVVTCRPIRLCGLRTHTRCCITCAGVMTLI